jgi:hypothetical protein
MHVSSIPAGQGFYDVSFRVGVSSIKQLDVQPVVFFLCQGWDSFDTRTMRTEFALSTGLTESGPICSCGQFFVEFAATLRGQSGRWQTKRRPARICVELPSPRWIVFLDFRAPPTRLLVSALSHRTFGPLLVPDCKAVLHLHFGDGADFWSDQAETTGTE